MFALWYLSFAIDEIRKHFGWFFNNIKIKGAKNAIENKPQATPQPPTAAAPAPAPASVAKTITENKPTPTPTPTPKPTQPEIRPTADAPPSAPAPAPSPAPARVPTPPKPIEKPAPATPPTTPEASPSIRSPAAPSPAALKRETVAADALDRKLQEASKPFENGKDKIKANLKDATTGFLQSESQKAPERYSLVF